LHKKNRHKQGYNFARLVKANPELSRFIIKNKYNNQDTIDFADPLAVKSLNFSLLKSDYNIAFWDIPDGYLCPAIPGRVDYIHHLHELLETTTKAAKTLVPTDKYRPIYQLTPLLDLPLNYLQNYLQSCLQSCLQKK